jgi:DNA helicase-2/ATP-dependent DNA helicase PcrA
MSARDTAGPETLEEHLALLNPEQAAAVTHTGSPLLILAGAGSGKTRVITTKIAYLISRCAYSPSSILAVTFTKKAAQEMAERARGIDGRASGAFMRTFHSFGAWFLRCRPGDAGLARSFTVYDEEDSASLLHQALPSLDKKRAAVLARSISLAKDYCLSPDSEGLSRIDPSPEFPGVYAAYEKRLRETGNADFGDLIMLPVNLLSRNGALREDLHRRFRCVMVDEYQDANIAQFRLLELLAGEGTYICVVGDDDQSIYRFRGAEVRNILSFREHFKNTEVIRLERNYRSFAPILALAQCIVSKNPSRLGKTLRATRAGGDLPVLAFLPNQEAEAAFCAGLITAARKDEGTPYSHWAVLYRTNAQSAGFESLFLRSKIPYRVVGSLKFYQREEIKDALAYIALAANPRDEIAFRRAAAKPPRGIGEASQDKIIAAWRDGKGGDILEAARSPDLGLPKKAAEGLSGFVSAFEEARSLFPEGDDRAGALMLSRFVERLIVLGGLSAYYEAEDAANGTQRAGNLSELVNNAALYPLTSGGLLDFLDAIQLDRTLEAEAGEDGRDAVTLITLHNTKGLEFPRVIITGMESGVFPRTDKTGQELEEERRLFYVGVTRARDKLYLTSCAERRFFGKPEGRTPSPFLKEIDASLIQVAPVGRTSGAWRQSGAAGTHAGPQSQGEWPVGGLVYHDDYGYGTIISANTGAGELVIKVRMETGQVATFLPEYQKNSLVRIKER